ncbi:hypothetical protein JK204_12680 [Tatumella sp. JGM16]|nr:hypothetical protein [Tatumella sp. JGM16]MBS0913729.1 hypothetical protein [Tatumella sp. JGM91]
MPGPGIACSGGYAWFKRRYQVSLRQPFRLNCDNAVRRAFSAAKQQYGAPRLAAELPEYNVKTIAVSQHRKSQPGVQSGPCCHFWQSSE